ncbi:MAG: penicillin-binding protein activator [Alphaproteobacteria bacterium]|nr:penicillin-binding protein activator [Alphaproteobacteria bacterium]
MHINKFLIFLGIFLASCGTNRSITKSQPATSNPTDIQESYLYSTSVYGSDSGGPTANIAVLLPMTGDAKSVGNDIKTSLETAFLRKIKPNIKISFYDLSGDKTRRETVIHTALYENPDIIIGPLFAEDTLSLREMKSSKIPVISFTSDVNSLGDNVMTMNLIPTQSIEAIIRQMQQDGSKNMIILAPNDNSGKLMASVASKVSSAYDIPIKGLFYYTPGNSDSIKEVSMRASMYSARSAANSRAREVLSDILAKEPLSAQQKYSLRHQLEKISRTETLGDLPYDSILFLGNGEDSKTLASFLRYYGVGNRDAAFYGTTLWHGSDIASDFTMSGAKYAKLPEISNNFISLYNMMAGKDPDYLAAFGYDAANLALGMLFSQKGQSAFLFDPSGYTGTSGIFRLQPSGESERALRIMELNGTGTAGTLVDAPKNFLNPLYSVNTASLRQVSEKELSTRGINPGDYITIPDDLRRKSAYRTKTLGANYVADSTDTEPTYAPVEIYESETTETVSNPEFESAKSETISRKYIDSVEIEE